MTTPTLTARLDAALYVIDIRKSWLPIADVRKELRKRGLPTKGTAGVLLVRLYEGIKQ